MGVCSCPSAVSSIVSNLELKLEREINSKNPLLMSSIDGVHLPLDSEFVNFQSFKSLVTLTGESQVDLAKWLVSSKVPIAQVDGVSKDAKDAIKPVHDVFKYELIKNKDKLPNDYQYFGSGDNVNNLCYFAKNNPFFASTLIAKKGEKGEVQYQINSYTPPGKSFESFFGEAVTTLDQL